MCVYNKIECFAHFHYIGLNIKKKLCAIWLHKARLVAKWYESEHDEFYDYLNNNLWINIFFYIFNLLMCVYKNR